MAIWTDLLYGNGFWLGFILISAIMFIISASVKWGGFFSCAMSILMFMVYYQNVTANTFEYWGVILMGISAVIHLMIGISGD
jgi:hypothetical protein